MKNNPPLKILLADDHPLFLVGLESLLDSKEWFEIVGKANSKQELIALNKKLKPDFVFTDISMPRREDGIAAIYEIKKKKTKTKVVALTYCDKDDTILRTLEAGADAYLLKNVTIDQLCNCILDLRENKQYYSPEIYFKLKDLIARNCYKPYLKKANIKFSEIDLKIIELICEEYNAEEIAKIIHLSQRTVEGYRSKIIKRMQVKNAIGVAIYAIQNELVEYKNITLTKKLKNIWLD
ncbi:MAG: hypothetical protein RJA07_1134 [Bacteroidota bacterium]